jgi:hypothetical protein
MGGKFFAKKIIYLNTQSGCGDNWRVSDRRQWWAGAARRSHATQQTNYESSVNERGSLSCPLHSEVLIHVQDNLSASDCFSES